MNPYRNAFRVLTRRYMDDFQFNEARFEEEDGVADDGEEIAEEEETTEPDPIALESTQTEIEFKEAA